MSVSSKTQSASFQSTLSVRRATFNDNTPRVTDTISIHALREESDDFNNAGYAFTLNFNPRSP